MNMISGGRIGDFLHQLFIPAIIYEKYKIKTNLFIANIGDNFTNGIDQSFKELYEVVSQQEYINNFEIYNNQKIDHNLSEWRSNNPNIGWTDKLYQKYISSGKSPYKNFKIVNYNTNDKNLKNSLIINRSSDSRRYSSNIEIQKNIINKFEKKYFIYTNIDQYINYPLKHLVQPLYADSVGDFFKAINSCKLFMGNLSAPMAIAYSLKKNILCEFGSIDSQSYKLETEYYDNISWYNDQEIFLSESFLRDLK